MKAIPELLKLLDIQESTVTTDAVGTQTQIMEQILSQKGHFVLMVKKNQPQSYEEIVKYFGEMSEDRKRMKEEKTTGRDTPGCRKIRRDEPEGTEPGQTGIPVVQCMHGK